MHALPRAAFVSAKRTTCRMAAVYLVRRRSRTQTASQSSTFQVRTHAGTHSAAATRVTNAARVCALHQSMYAPHDNRSRYQSRFSTKHARAQYLFARRACEHPRQTQASGGTLLPQTQICPGKALQRTSRGAKEQQDSRHDPSGKWAPPTASLVSETGLCCISSELLALGAKDCNRNEFQIARTQAPSCCMCCPRAITACDFCDEGIQVLLMRRLSRAAKAITVISLLEYAHRRSVKSHSTQLVGS
eukprot:503596-Pleurochrysis_carterae.AAC.1